MSPKVIDLKKLLMCYLDRGGNIFIQPGLLCQWSYKKAIKNATKNNNKNSTNRKEVKISRNIFMVFQGTMVNITENNVFLLVSKRQPTQKKAHTLWYSIMLYHQLRELCVLSLETTASFLPKSSVNLGNFRLHGTFYDCQTTTILEQSGEKKSNFLLPLSNHLNFCSSNVVTQDFPTLRVNITATSNSGYLCCLYSVSDDSADAGWGQQFCSKSFQLTSNDGRIWNINQYFKSRKREREINQGLILLLHTNQIQCPIFAACQRMQGQDNQYTITGGLNLAWCF